MVETELILVVGVFAFRLRRLAEGSNKSSISSVFADDSEESSLSSELLDFRRMRNCAGQMQLESCACCRLGGDNACTSLAVSCDTRDVLILMYMPLFLMILDEVKGSFDLTLCAELPT